MYIQTKVKFSQTNMHYVYVCVQLKNPFNSCFLHVTTVIFDW